MSSPTMPSDFKNVSTITLPSRRNFPLSLTRPPIAAGPIDRALKFLKRMSVNVGAAVSDAGEGLVDALVVEAGVLVAVSSAAGEVVDGRVPTRVADGV